MKFPNIYDENFRKKVVDQVRKKAYLGKSILDTTGYSSMEAIAKNFGVLPPNSLSDDDFDMPEVVDKELEPVSPARTLGFDYADASEILNKIDPDGSFRSSYKKTQY